MNRDLDTDRLRRSLRSAAYTGGIDFRHEWAGRTWTVDGFVAGSYVTGSREVITATQAGAPWHYFGRPDADHLAVDSAATSLTGLSALVRLDHRVGRHWRGSILAGTTTPGYEVNDLGFQYRADRIDAQASIDYGETRPGDFLRAWQVGADARAERSYAGETIMNLVGFSAFARHLSYWSAEFGINHFGESVNDRLTRGGPAARRPASTSFFGGIGTDGRKPYVAGVFGFYEADVEGGRSRSLELELEIKPATRWNLTLSPFIERSRSGAQYLGAVPDPFATSTFGVRYLFSTLDQTMVGMETRLNLTFNPRLSLQLYAQPFLSSADFGAPAELRAPGTYDFRVYGEDGGEVRALTAGTEIDPDGAAGPAEPFGLPPLDFNLRSLRGNAVLRWEWRPGSTLYLAWQQDRSHTGTAGDFDFGRDRRALFRAPPDNVLVLKVNYWMNP